MSTQREPPWPTPRCLEATISLSYTLGFIFRPGIYQIYDGDDYSGLVDDDDNDDNDGSQLQYLWRHGG